ncbi:hypothetical protein [Litoreibacter albidus]|uniref:Uncharacterized protein n=1 Tax=Litoreibacter albidus TaxID=670155 RepID=A0A1H3DBJ6_9RHOB|nr:hypothetical protein [Litoreibacter albidus]SDX63736.1 hypothetical protein SAMN04488001_0093 [Litoreibacter albidus]
MRLRFGLAVILCAAGMAAPLAGGAMGWLGNAAPTAIALSDASHSTSPVMIEALEINGRAYGTVPYLASTDWDDPHGGNRTIAGLAVSPQDDAQIVVRATWVEIYTNRAYSGELTLPAGAVSIRDAGDRTALLTVVFGRAGHFAVSTDPKPNSSDAPFYEIVAEVCAQREPSLDKDYRADINADLDLAWTFEQESVAAAAEPVATPCRDGGDN